LGEGRERVNINQGGCRLTERPKQPGYQGGQVQKKVFGGPKKSDLERRDRTRKGEGKGSRRETP